MLSGRASSIITAALSILLALGMHMSPPSAGPGQAVASAAGNDGGAARTV